MTHWDAQIQRYFMLPRQKKASMELYEVGPEFFCCYNDARLAALYEQGMKPPGPQQHRDLCQPPTHSEANELTQHIAAAGN